MNRILLILFIITFIFVPVFSFISMHHVGTNCIATLAGGTECPMDFNSLNMAVFHLDSLGFFSLAISDINIIFLIVVVGFLFLFGITREDNYNSYSTQYKNINRYDKCSDLLTLFRNNFFNWFKIHENSPALISLR